MKHYKQYSKNVRLFGDIVGWYGMLAIIGAYALISFELIESDSLGYQLLNLTGAIGLMVIGYIKGVAQSVVLNIFWSLIAVVALIGLVL